jgi:hypothetical protein
MACSSAALWKAMLSSAARAMWATVLPRVRPVRVPRAFGVPVGCAQAGEGRHEHHAAGIGHAFGQGLHLAAGLDRVQAVAQPLHHRTADEHAALQGEFGVWRQVWAAAVVIRPFSLACGTCRRCASA